MKYHFVWDEGFLGNQMLELSEREKNIVIAIIIGGHNATFTGYRTERLVKAVKLLQDVNTPFVSVESPIEPKSLIGEYSRKGLTQGFVTDADNGFLHFSDISSQNGGVTSWLTTVMGNGWIKLCDHGDIVTLPAKFQLIAEASNLDNRNVATNHIMDYCDIRYDCPKDCVRTLYSVEDLRHRVSMVKEHRQSLGYFGNNSYISDIGDIQPTNVALEMIEEENIGIETARLGRTMADIFGHNKTFGADLEAARNCQNICM